MITIDSIVEAIYARFLDGMVYEVGGVSFQGIKEIFVRDNEPSKKDQRLIDLELDNGDCYEIQITKKGKDK